MNQISACTRKSFHFIFSLSILLECHCIAAFALPRIYYRSAKFVWSIVRGFILILIAQSSTLMAYHFIRFYRNLDGKRNNDEDVICIATKITLLNTVCVLSFFAASACKVIVELYGRNHHSDNVYLHLKIASRMVWSLDTLINFMTVYLSFKFTNGCYMK